MNSPDADSANVIFHQTSPDGQIHALVEQDERVAYFYLASELPTFPTKACWVRNLGQGPLTLDNREMEQGLAPALPRMVCHHPQGAEPLVAERLTVIWFEEGNGAALLEGSEVLAMIPPWSGEDGFHGYARDCKAENPVCWPLPEDPRLRERLQQAQQWWNEWSTGNPWKQRQQELLSGLEIGLGPHQKYFSIDGQKWPPKGLALFHPSGWMAVVTVGVSLRPQPRVELYAESPRQIARIELGVLAADQPAEVLIERVGGWLSGMTNYPWYQQSWLGHGHTSTLQVHAAENGQNYPCVIFCEHGELLTRLNAAQLPPAAQGFREALQRIRLPAFRDCPTNLLWAIPISADEQAWVSSHGSSRLLDDLVTQPERLFFPAAAPV